MEPTPDAPIGALDSGVGGLSVLRDLRRLLPAEDVLYVGDQAYVPYGGRPSAELEARTEAIVRVLVGEGVKLVVVPCNTATVSAVAHLRATFDVPIVGTEPAVKPAAATSRTRVIGVLATPTTLAVDRFQALVETHAADVRVLTVAARGLVERIELGDLDGPLTRALLAEQLTPLAEAGIDRLVLGSTHFPFLAPAIADLLGPGVELVASGEPVSRRVRAVLEERDLLRDGGHAGRVTVRSTRLAPGGADVIRRLLGEDVPVTELRL